jgi:hypothetical protein
MNFLYSNLLLNTCILLLLILLIYLYKYHKKKELWMFITWTFLIIASIFSIYLAYSLTKDISIISQIYQSYTHKSVVNYNTIDPSVNQIERAIEFLYTNLGLSVCIFYSLDLLIALYINTKIVSNKWEFTYIKSIFGERYHKYFMKGLTFTSKSNELWMYIIFILSVIASISAIFMVYFLINYIDLITELYQYQIKKKK